MKSNKIENWIIGHAFLMVLMGIVSLYTFSCHPLLLVGCLSFFVLGYLEKSAFANLKPYAGYANWITFFRLLLLMIVVLWLNDFSNIQLFGVFSICLLLDGLDGFIARFYQQESDWGALFDKEVDSFFVLLLSLILYQQYSIPYWILGIGFLHYLYELALYVLKWQHIKTKKNPIGRYVAFFLFTSLLSPFILSQKLAILILGMASIGIVVSFGISFSFKYQQTQIQA